MDNLKVKVVERLIKEHLTITAAESLTAGEFQSSLGDIAGVSAIFAGGLVTYSNHAKHMVLGVPGDLIEKDGVVSKSVAISMADHAKDIYHTKVALSFTGAAGPDSLEGHPAGTVWIGLAFPEMQTEAKLFHFDGDRNQVRQKCVDQAFQLLNEKLN